MTIWDIAHRTTQNIDHFEIHVGNFLDEFYRSDPEKREKMVEREPLHDDKLPSHILPFLAGMVHKLCNDYGVKGPVWVSKGQYIMKEPYFPLNAKGNLRQLLLAESPMEFRIRNIFTSENCLTRV
jgi:hypothetical protein